MKIQTAFVLLAAVTSAAAMGCGTSSDAQSTGPTGKARASLHRAKGCGDLLADLKADATYKVNKGIDRQIESIQKCIARSGSDQNCAYGGYLGGYGGGFGAAEDSANSKGAPPPSQGAPTGAGTATPTSPTPSATSHSETNTQVAGVDEADFVKTDGSNLYVIHGSAFKVVKAWPAADLKELSSLTIEGTPSEMFVADGKVVVYSQVNGASLYTAAGVTPKANYTDYGYAYGGGGGIATDARAPYPYPNPGGTPEPYIPLTKITVLTLNGATPTVAREVYFEGNYLDSRRVGSHVRTVLTGNAHGPKLKYSIYELYPQPVYPTYPSGPDYPSKDDGTGTGTGTGTTQPDPYPKTGTEMIAALEQLRAVNKAAIDASVLGDWMPYTFTRQGAAVQATSVACEDFYVPSTGSTEAGLTEVASIDLANPSAAPRETAILGRADTVYGSADTIYLAAHGYIEPPYSWMDSQGTSGSGTVGVGGSVPPSQTDTAPAPAPLPPSGTGTKTVRPTNTPATTTPIVTAWATNETHVHKFEFATDASFPNYVASGTVVGSVKDQFSLDDRNGYLRIATTENRNYLDETGKYVSPTFPGSTGPQDRPSNVNHVFVMGVSGGWLDLVGDVGEIAPNEQIYSVRFVDGRGYVVTFRRTDPLFVIDMNDPKKPTKLAELTIPGFSEYMHPLDANHILTIGRAGTATGQVQGLQLQIFDVTNGANPIVAHKFTYTGSEYGMSEAEHEHKAFTYFADQKTLAFPYYAYSSTGGGMRSSLELFKVETATGFAKLGSVDNTDLVAKNPTGYCGGYYGPEVRRGVFLDNFVYSISYGGVVAKDTNNLAGAGVKLLLPTPVVNTGYGPPCAEPATF